MHLTGKMGEIIKMPFSMKIGFLDANLLQRNIIIIFSKDKQDWALDLMPVLSFTDNPCMELQKKIFINPQSILQTL